MFDSFSLQFLPLLGSLWRELARRVIAVAEGECLSSQAEKHVVLPLFNARSLSLAALDSSLPEGAKGCRWISQLFDILCFTARSIISQTP